VILSVAFGLFSVMTVTTSDGKPELVSSTQDLMSSVAAQYREEQKQSCNTPAPLPELHFFYEGPEVSSSYWETVNV